MKCMGKSGRGCCRRAGFVFGTETSPGAQSCRFRQTVISCSPGDMDIMFPGLHVFQQEKEAAVCKRVDEEKTEKS